MSDTRYFTTRGNATRRMRQIDSQFPKAQLAVAGADGRFHVTATTPAGQRDALLAAGVAIAAPEAPRPQPKAQATAFRPGSKRAAVHALLSAGTTVAAAMAASGWDRATTSAEFYLIAKALEQRVARDGRGDAAIFRLARR
jgi:hypothetical protein